MKVNELRTTIRSILIKQDELNKKYTGEDWRKVVPTSKFEIAVFTEVAEFFESCPEQWKWWKPYLKNDKQNLYIEVVDVLHFGASICLQAKSIDEIVNGTHGLSEEGESIIKRQSRFLITRNINDLLLLLEEMCNFAGLEYEKIFEIYTQKHKLNEDRISGGYMKGEYEKVKNGQEDNRSIKVD
jgi:dimeric dUTPase (all-alpha-NTP-PPase superfamily)